MEHRYNHIVIIWSAFWLLRLRLEWSSFGVLWRIKPYMITDFHSLNSKKKPSYATLIAQVVLGEKVPGVDCLIQMTQAFLILMIQTMTAVRLGDKILSVACNITIIEWIKFMVLYFFFWKCLSLWHQQPWKYICFCRNLTIQMKRSQAQSLRATRKRLQ